MTEAERQVARYVCRNFICGLQDRCPECGFGSDALKHARAILALHQQCQPPPSVTADKRDALQKLETICDEIFGRWDKDQRPGKLLTALAGRLPRYRQDVDEVRAALTAHERVPTIEGVSIDAVADAIDEARYRHPTHPRERPRPFSEADEGDREYARRMARAALRVVSQIADDREVKP